MPNSENYSYSPDFAEYITPPSKNKKYELRKAGIILGAALLFIAAFLLFSMAPKFAFLALPIIFGVAFCAWFFWRFTKAEFEYYIAQGEMHFDVIYGERTRKQLYTCKISSIKKIYPAKEAEVPGGSGVIEASSSHDATNALCAEIVSENGEKEFLFFEANEKIIKIMRGFNPSVFFNFKF